MRILARALGLLGRRPIVGAVIFVALFLGFTMLDAEGYRENLIYRSSIRASQPGATGTEIDD